MSKITEAAAEWRERLLGREDRATAEIRAAYGRAVERTAAELLSLLESFGPGRSRVQIERLEAILPLLEEEFRRFGGIAEGAVTGAQRDVAALAYPASGAVAEAQRVGVSALWAAPPLEATERLVGNLGDGSPLRRIFDSFGEQASASARAAIGGATARGIGPREAARELRAALEGGAPPGGFGAELLGRTGDLLYRSGVIARTEILRAHREATHEVYDANAGLLSGWMWLARLDVRTCPVCWAMHGTVHPLSDRFGGHTQCRCTSGPVLQGETPETLGIQTGEAAFAALPESQRRTILGPGKLALYDAGDIRLRDLVRRKKDPEWGTERTEVPLKALREGGVSRLDPRVAEVRGKLARAIETGEDEPNLYDHPVLGRIEALQGDSKFGLRHIVERRNLLGQDLEGVLDEAAFLMVHGEFREFIYANRKRVRLLAKSTTHVVAMTDDYRGEGRRVLITAHPLDLKG